MEGVPKFFKSGHMTTLRPPLT